MVCNQKDIEPTRAPQHGECCFSKEPEHRVGGKLTALRSVPQQRRHRGSWAPAFAADAKPACARAPCRRSADCAEARHLDTARSRPRGARLPTRPRPSERGEPEATEHWLA